MINESNKGTIRDVEGKFSISKPGDNTSLVFNFIGFVSKEMDILSKSPPLEVVMQPDVKALSEVVVIGYGSRKASMDEEAEIVKPLNHQ